MNIRLDAAKRKRVLRKHLPAISWLGLNLWMITTFKSHYPTREK